MTQGMKSSVGGGACALPTDDRNAKALVAGQRSRACSDERGKTNARVHAARPHGRCQRVCSSSLRPVTRSGMTYWDWAVANYDGSDTAPDDDGLGHDGDPAKNQHSEPGIEVIEIDDDVITTSV